MKSFPTKTPSPLSFIVVVILILSLFSVSMFSAEGDDFGTSRREITAETFDELPNWEDMTDHQTRDGHFRSSEHYDEIPDDDMDVQINRSVDDYIGTSEGGTVEHSGHHGEWRLGRKPDENSPKGHYQFEDVDSPPYDVAIDSSEHDNHLDLIENEGGMQQDDGVYGTDSAFITETAYLQDDTQTYFGNDEFAFDTWFQADGDDIDMDTTFVEQYEGDDRLELGVLTEIHGEEEWSYSWDDSGWWEDLQATGEDYVFGTVGYTSMGSDFYDGAGGYKLYVAGEDGTFRTFGFDGSSLTFDTQYNVHDTGTQVSGIDWIGGQEVVTTSDDEVARYYYGQDEVQWKNNMSSGGTTLIRIGSSIFVGRTTGYVAEYNTDNGELESYDEYHSDYVSDLFVDDNGNIISSSHDNTVRYGDASSGDQMWNHSFHGDDVLSVSYDYVDDIVYSFGRDDTIYGYHADREEIMFEQDETCSGARGMDAIGRELYVSTDSDMVRGFDMEPRDQWLQYELTDADGTTEGVMKEFELSGLSENQWNYMFFGLDSSTNDIFVYKNFGGGEYQDSDYVTAEMNWDWSSPELRLFEGFEGNIDRTRLFDYGDVPTDWDEWKKEYSGYIEEASYDDEVYRNLDVDWVNYITVESDVSGASFETFELKFDTVNFEIADDISGGTERFYLEDMYDVSELKLSWTVSESDFNIETPVFYYHAVEIEYEEENQDVIRTSSEERVDGLFSYRMHMQDDALGYGMGANISWHTNTPTYEKEPFPIFSLHNMFYYVRIIQGDEYGTPVSWDSDNDVEIRHYTDGDVSEIIEEDELDKTGSWQRIENRETQGLESSGFTIEVDTADSFEGHIIVQVDYIQYTTSVSEVFPRMYNKFTGEGIDQDRLIVQYKDAEDDWRFISGDSFWQVQRRQTEIRVMDFWGQQVWNDTVEPRMHEEIVRIPIPIIMVQIERPDIPEQDERGWYLETPWFTIGSRETGQTQQVQSWEMEIVAGRSYEFVWEPFAQYLGGSQMIDLGYQLDEPVFPQDVGTATAASTDGDDGIETDDEQVSNIRGGQALADLTLHIDPEETVGRPPLHLNPIEIFGGNSDHWEYFPKHQMAAFAYDVLRIDYEWWNPYRDGYRDYVFAITGSPVFHFMWVFVLTIGFVWYILRIRGVLITPDEYVDWVGNGLSSLGNNNKEEKK